MSHAGDDESSNTSGKRAVKTTIVGGQSQENRRPLPPIPVGIEQLLSIAAVSNDFAAALLQDRDAAIEAAALELTPTERRILDAVDDRALRRMIASAEGSVPDRDRRAFLTRSAAALLVLAGGSVLASASACGDDKGAAPAPTPPRPAPPPEPAPAPAGVRPDRPEPPQPPPADAGAPDAAAASPHKPEPPMAGVRPSVPRPTRGIQPDRPIVPPTPAPAPADGDQADRPDDRKTRGIRPDRPDDRKTRGIRPDRPGDGEDL